MDKRSLSKFLSLILRHKPEVIGVKLDEEGWCSVDELIQKCRRKGKNIDIHILREIVAEDNKGRYSFGDGEKKIRANQGHSLKVDMNFKEVTPPKYLYHGTVERFMVTIMKEGLRKMKRQYVHLSEDLSTARNVGRRRGEAVILRIDADRMYRDGVKFYLSENDVWLTDRVSVEYIERT